MSDKRVYILEGPDGSGKTTLAQALTREVQGVLVHHGSYLKSDGHDLEDVYTGSLLLAEFVNVVLDRCWISEPIYGEVMRSGVNRMSSHAVRALERLAEAQRATVVLCLPPLEVCCKTFEGRPEEEYLRKIDELARVWEGYAEVLPGGKWRTSLPVVTYDRTRWDGNHKEFVKALVEGRLS